MNYMCDRFSKPAMRTKYSAFRSNMYYRQPLKIREYIKSLEADMAYPNKSNAKIIYKFDKEQYKDRNVVDRYFQKLKCYRRIAARYDKLACVYRAFIYIASFLIKIGNNSRENSLKIMYATGI